jgi:hypothetical protein
MQEALGLVAAAATASTSSVAWTPFDDSLDLERLVAIRDFVANELSGRLHVELQFKIFLLIVFRFCVFCIFSDTKAKLLAAQSLVVEAAQRRRVELKQKQLKAQTMDGAGGAGAGGSGGGGEAVKGEPGLPLSTSGGTTGGGGTKAPKRERGGGAGGSGAGGAGAKRARPPSGAAAAKKAAQATSSAAAVSGDTLSPHPLI